MLCWKIEGRILWILKRRESDKRSQKLFDPNLPNEELDMNIFKINENTIRYREVYESPDGSRRVFILKMETADKCSLSETRAFLMQNIWDMWYMKMKENRKTKDEMKMKDDMKTKDKMKMKDGMKTKDEMKMKDDMKTKEKMKMKDDRKTKDEMKMKDDMKTKEKMKMKDDRKTKDEMKMKDDIKTKDKMKMKDDMKTKDKMKMKDER